MNKRILFVIDEVEFKYFEFNKLVTDFWLILEFLKSDFEVFVTTKNRLFLESSTAFTFAFETYKKIVSNDSEFDIFYQKNEMKIGLNDFKAIFFRPDPPVDIDYINACYIFDYVDKQKTFVINDPVSVRNFNEKFHINYFTEFVPKNIVTSSKKVIENFLRNENEIIIKPLNRCFGSGVYYLSKNDKNINSIITTATNSEKTLVMAQKYIPIGIKGDKRVLILGKTVFDECVMKLPTSDDFKFSNHSDEYFAKSSLTKNEREIAQAVANELYKKGLYMVGLDIIDEKIIEINVTSPCYFIKEINAFSNIRFEKKIMENIFDLINAHGDNVNCACEKFVTQ